jgi:arylformamidase
VRALHAVPWLALLLYVAIAEAAAAPRVERDIPYAFIKGDAAALRRQSFDLYLPAASKPPLVVFIHGGFWVESDDEYKIGPRIAEALVADGAAVALVRYRLSPQVRHPTHVRDVAAALAGLKRFADRYGYDAKRLYLVGHSAGATLAALLALDPAYLREVGMKPADIAGAVLISGIYDLGPAGPLTSQHAKILAATFGEDAAVRRSASPLTHVRSGPRLFVLTAANDFPGFAIDARRFVKALGGAGHRQVQELIAPGLNHFTITDLHKDRLVRAITNGFMGLKPLDPQTATLMQLRSRWQQPPFSSEPFWTSGVAVRTRAVDARLRAALEKVYEYNAYELAAYPLARYHAVDLLEYLNRLPPERVGSGDYLTITNYRGERLYFTREQLATHRPQLVIGLDDERNLFRLSVFYQNKLEYTWRAEKPPIMARSVGAFIHFIKEPPANLVPDTRAHFSLTPDSFRFTPTDPLVAVASTPVEVHKVLTQTNACLSCHGFRGAGARAGHVEAATGKMRGGFALAFEEYPPEAWRRFMLEPEAAARMIGVRANPVEGAAARLLYELVEAERAGNSKKQ